MVSFTYTLPTGTVCFTDTLWSNDHAAPLSVNFPDNSTDLQWFHQAHASGMTASERQGYLFSKLPDPSPHTQTPRNFQQEIDDQINAYSQGYNYVHQWRQALTCELFKSRDLRDHRAATSSSAYSYHKISARNRDPYTPFEVLSEELRQCCRPCCSVSDGRTIPSPSFRDPVPDMHDAFLVQCAVDMHSAWRSWIYRLRSTVVAALQPAVGIELRDAEDAYHERGIYSRFRKSPILGHFKLQWYHNEVKYRRLVVCASLAAQVAHLDEAVSWQIVIVNRRELIETLWDHGCRPGSMVEGCRCKAETASGQWLWDWANDEFKRLLERPEQ